MIKTPALLHYVHCPFCIRVRMAFGLFELEYKSELLSYDDEKTPLELMNKKMLPIVKFVDGSISNESLDIIQTLDKKNLLNYAQYTNQAEEIESLLSVIGNDVHSLAMPYWIWTSEFNDQSRQYFLKKKEIKRGPFSELVKNQSKFVSSLNTTLLMLELNLSPYYKSDSLTINDIIIASHLWGMFVVPEFQFSDKIYQYLIEIKKQTRFNYHEDLWN